MPVGHVGTRNQESTMNKDQRKTIAAITARIGDIENSKAFVAVSTAMAAFEEAKDALIGACDAAADLLEEIKQDVEGEHTDEQDKFDNMPEGLQQGENGQEMERCIEQLDSAMGALDEAIEKLRDEDACLTEDGHAEVQTSLETASEALEEI